MHVLKSGMLGGHRLGPIIEVQRLATKLHDSCVCTVRWPAVLLQDAQLSQRDRAAGCVIVFAKSRRLELGDNILQTL